MAHYQHEKRKSTEIQGAVQSRACGENSAGLVHKTRDLRPVGASAKRHKRAFFCFFSAICLSVCSLTGGGSWVTEVVAQPSRRAHAYRSPCLRAAKAPVAAARGANRNRQNL